MPYFLILPLFPLGEILLSPGAEDLGIGITRLIRRHQAGDWADLCAEDKKANQQALATNEAILSLYPFTAPDGMDVTICIMTEGDRSQTVVMLLGDSIGETCDE